MNNQKKRLLIVLCLVVGLFMISIPAFAQKVITCTYSTSDGIVAYVAFSGTDMVIKQGGEYKAFTLTSNDDNGYLYSSSDNWHAYFSDDLKYMTLGVGSKPLYTFQLDDYDVSNE